jgi:PAS domain S-box-containing protein
LLFAVGYVALDYFAQWLAHYPGRSTILCLAGGLYLATLLSSDPRTWWRWAITVFVVEACLELLMRHESVASALVDAVGHVTGVLAGAHLLRLRRGLPFRLASLDDLFALYVVAIVVSPAIRIGLNVIFHSVVGRSITGMELLTDWAGEAATLLTVTPLILMLKQYASQWRTLSAAKWLEGAVMVIALAGVLHIIFTGQQPLVYLTLPWIVWGALRFGLLGITLILATFMAIIIHYSASGLGPYGATPYSALLAQSFLAVLCVGSLCLAVTIQQYQAGQLALRRARDELEQRVADRTAALAQSELRLRESNALYEIARAAAKVIIFDWQVETDTVSYSDDPTWLRGPLPASGKYPLFKDQVHEQDRARFLEVRQRALDTLQGGIIDFRLVRTDGIVLWVQSHPTIFAGADGKAARLLTSIQDISARKQIEASLRESEQRLRALLDGIPERAWFKDAKGRYVAVNRATEEGYGLPAAELIGKTIFDLRPREVAEHIAAEEDKVIAGGKLMRIERPSFTFGNWVEITKAPVFDTDGQYAGMAGIWRDITVRKQAEQQALAQSERRYRTLVNATSQSVWVMDATGHSASILKSLTGETVANAKEHPWLNFVHPEDRAGAIAVAQTATASKAAYEYQHRVLNKNGDCWDVVTRVAPVLNADGSVREWIGTSADISAQKRAERALLESNQTLRRLSGRREEVLEAERARIAHNLHDGASQSLNLARLKLAALANQPALATTEAQLREILAVIDQVNHEIRTLEFELSPPVLRQLGLVPALRWLGDEMQRSYGLHVSVSDDEEDKVQDQVSRATAFRAVRELLINVAKHAKVDAAHVDVHRLDESIVITVSDRGVGFDAASVTQGNFGNPGNSSASGLGLPMVKESIEFSGGSVRFDSSPGGGAANTITMPLDREMV